jgi:hypothetical protein
MTPARITQSCFNGNFAQLIVNRQTRVAARHAQPCDARQALRFCGSKQRQTP